MLTRLKQTAFGQVVALTAVILICFAAEALLHIRLSVRPSISAFFLGLAWLVPTYICWLIVVSRSGIAGTNFRPRLAAGRILVSACAEEPLLRGVVVTALRPLSPTFAAVSACGFTFLLYFRGRGDFRIALSETMKAAVLAVAYLQTYSLFVVIVARGGTEILSTFNAERLISPASVIFRFKLLKNFAKRYAVSFFKG